MESATRIFASGLNCFHEFLAIELRNMEAIGLAQQKMLEGVGVLAQRQAEIAEGTFRRAFGTQPFVPTTASAIHAAVIGQIDSIKTTMMESQANSNILTELAARNSGDVANILQSRMMAALDEVKAALEQAAPDKLSAVAPVPLTVQPVSPA
ncbi:MAG: hypothetical protein WCK95_07285 [Alphaproteobacteria bacterium]|jgi:hypothetical protein